MGYGGGCPLLSVDSADAPCALVMRDGKAGQAASPFQMGDTAGMTGDVAPLHGALATQGCVSPMMTAHRTHRRLLCASRA